VAVTKDMRRRLWHRAMGRCECVLEGCPHHEGRCNALLTRGWRAHHRTPGGPDALSNLVAMCETCYEYAHRFEDACVPAEQKR
jgi:hypothetical protein